MSTTPITFLDLSAMDAGDLDFSALESLGSFKSFPMTQPGEVAARLAGAEVAIVNKVVVGADVMDACPSLKLIQLAATGFNNIDVGAAAARGITVCNVRGYGADTVAQHTIGLLLNLATSIHRFAGEATRWCDSPIFTRLDYPATDLAGKQLGIVGGGAIGSKVGDIASALGMRVQILARAGSDKPGTPDRPRVPADEFFATSDAITLHCPLTAENRQMINAETLTQMKPSAFLINTARGDLVDEPALAAALVDGTIAAAGLDVLSQEPPPADHPLIRLTQSHPERILISPHSAWTSTEARTRLLEGIVSNILAWQAGSPTNEVT